jgi:hypothetical protein
MAELPRLVCHQFTPFLIPGLQGADGRLAQVGVRGEKKADLGRCAFRV